MAKKVNEKRELKKAARQMSSPEQQESIDTTDPLTKKDVRKAKRGKGIGALAEAAATPSPVDPPPNQEDNTERVDITPQEPFVTEVMDQGTVEPSEASKALGSTVSNEIVAAKEDPTQEGYATPDDVVAQNMLVGSLVNPNERGLNATQQVQLVDESTEGRTVGEQISNDRQNATSKRTELAKAVEGGAQEFDPMKYIDKTSIDVATDEIMRNSWEYESDEFKARAKVAMKMLDNRNMAEGEPAIERLGLQEYYPTTGQRVAVGSYSRKTLGSGNIYSHGGFVMPMSIIDSRNRVIEQKAKDKAKKAQEIIESMWAQGAVQYQDKIDRMGMEMLDKYGEASNWDFASLSDRSTPLGLDFYKDMVRFQTFAKQTTEVEKTADRIGEMMVGKDSDSISVPADVEKAYYKWKNGMADMEEFFRNPKGYAQMAGLLKAYDSEIYYVKALAKELKGDGSMDQILLNPNDLTDDFYQAKDIDSAMKKISKGDSDVNYLTYLKLMDEDRVRQLAHSLYTNHNGFAPEISEEDVVKDLASMFGRQIDIKTHVHNHGNASRAQRERFHRDKMEEGNFFGRVLSAENQNIGVFASAVKNSTKDNRDGAVADVFRQGGMGSPNVGKDGKFINGEYLSNHNIPPGSEFSDSYGNLRYGSDGRYSYPEYKEALQAKLDEGKTLTDAEELVLQSNANDVVEASLTKSQTGIYVKTDNGTYRVANTDDGDGTISNGQSGIRLTFGGHVDNQSIKVRDSKNPSQFLKGTVYSYQDPAEPEAPPVYKAFLEGTEPGSGWVKQGYEDFIYKPVKGSLPPMRREILGNETNNVGVANQPYRTAGKLDTGSGRGVDRIVPTGGGGSTTTTTHSL